MNVAGRIRNLIDRLIELRTGGRAQMTHFVRAHLVLNGINPDEFDRNSPDHPDVVARLEAMIQEFGGKG